MILSVGWSSPVAHHHGRVAAVGGGRCQAGQALTSAHRVADEHPAVLQSEADHRVLLRFQCLAFGQPGDRHGGASSAAASQVLRSCRVF
jgi:hypothetical protein